MPNYSQELYGFAKVRYVPSSYISLNTKTQGQHTMIKQNNKDNTQGHDTMTERQQDGNKTILTSKELTMTRRQQ